MVISGDNASGKSTYLKTVAINAILAQGLGFAYGETLTLPHGHVLTAMDVSDDIEVGDSYFITESKAILRMIQHLKEPGFHYLTSSLRGPIPLSGSDQALGLSAG